MKSGLTRRDFLRAGGGALAGACVLGLAGCGGGEAGGEARLRMSWWGSEERNKRTNKVLDMFEKQNPGVTIDREFTGDFEAYWDKIATQTSGGNAPDLMQFSVNYNAEYTERGALLELGQFVPDTIDLEHFSDQVLASGKVGGELIGVTLGDNAQMLIYNAALLEKAGVEMPDYTWNWDDLKDFAANVSEAAGSDVFGAEDASGSEPAFEVFVRERGKELYDRDGRLAFGKTDLADWFAYWDDLRGSDLAPPAAMTAEVAGDITQSPIATGRAAATFSYSNLLTAYQTIIEDELDVNTYPGGLGGANPGCYLRASQLISASSRTEYPDEAAKVIEYLLNDPDAVKILGSERGIPGSTKSRSLVREQVDRTEKRTFDYLKLVVDNSAPMEIPRPPGTGEVAVLLTRMSEEVSFGRATIDESVDGFFSEAERILKQ